MSKSINHKLTLITQSFYNQSSKIADWINFFPNDRLFNLENLFIITLKEHLKLFLQSDEY